MRGVSGLRRKSLPSLIGIGKAAGLNGFGNDRDLEVVELGKLFAGDVLGKADFGEDRFKCQITGCHIFRL